MSEIAIVTEKLTRQFGGLTAVDHIDLQVKSGHMFGCLGPNGAGKSTTIKMVTGLLAPTSGRMQLLGIDFSANPAGVKRQIGVVPEGMGLFERSTGVFGWCSHHLYHFPSRSTRSTFCNPSPIRSTVKRMPSYKLSKLGFSSDTFLTIVCHQGNGSQP